MGEENRGWYQVAVALDFERSGIQAYAGGRRTLEQLVGVREGAARSRCERNPALRLRARRPGGRAGGRHELAYRIPWMQAQGKIPNHEASHVASCSAASCHSASR